MRSRFQCRALCGQATAHCCHIKAVILTPLVKCYGAPPHIQHSVRPIAGTVRPDQWINGCIELQAERVGVPVFEEVLLSSRAGPQVRVILFVQVHVSVKLTRLHEHCVLMLVSLNARRSRCAMGENFTKEHPIKLIHRFGSDRNISKTYWIDSHGILYRHSWSPGYESN